MTAVSACSVRCAWATMRFSLSRTARAFAMPVSASVAAWRSALASVRSLARTGPACETESLAPHSSQATSGGALSLWRWGAAVANRHAGARLGIDERLPDGIGGLEAGRLEALLRRRTGASE